MRHTHVFLVVNRFILSFFGFEKGYWETNESLWDLLKKIYSMEEIKIGNQIWTKRNLDVTNFRNGDAIRHIQTAEEWEKAGIKGEPAWCYYENSNMYGKIFGKLYNWYAIHDSRGLAPEGWVIPNEKEWDELIDFAGGEHVAGKILKSSTGWLEDGHGSDQFGFSALPNGFRVYDSMFDSLGYSGYWWTSSEFDSEFAVVRLMDYLDDMVLSTKYKKTYGLSVRCVKQ